MEEDHRNDGSSTSADSGLPSTNGSSASFIVRTPDVCFGKARIRGTRLPVWVLAQARRLGFSDTELLEDYPFINATQLEAAHGYAATHAAEIEEQIRRDSED